MFTYPGLKKPSSSALMIFSMGKVVYMYNLANLRDLDSFHCAGRPIFAAGGGASVFDI